MNFVKKWNLYEKRQPTFGISSCYCWEAPQIA